MDDGTDDLANQIMNTEHNTTTDGGRPEKQDTAPEETEGTQIDEPDRLDDENPYRIAVPILEETEAEATDQLVRTAATIAHIRDGELLVLCIVAVPEQTPYDIVRDDKPLMKEARTTAEQAVQAAATPAVAADGIVCLTHDEANAILNMTEQYACDAVLMNTQAADSQRWRLLKGDTVEKVSARAACDVFIQKFGGRADEPAERIFLPVAGGPHSGLATETTRALARADGAHVDVVHFLTDADDQRAEGEQILRGAANILNDVDHIDTSLVAVPDVSEEIVTRSDEYDVTVLGAPRESLLEQFVLGTVPDSIQQRTDNEVVVAKQNTGEPSAYYRWLSDDVPDENSLNTS